MTSSAIVPFTFEGHDVRVLIDLSGEPWWIAADVCRVLAISNVADALTRIDPLDIGSADVENSRGSRVRTKTVNESGLYELVFASRKPEAKEFRRWVTKEVLPTIRRTGGAYIQPGSKAEYDLLNDDTALDRLIEAAQVAKAERTRRIQAEQNLAIAAPKAEKFDEWQAAPDSVYVVEWAKKYGLTQQEGYEALRRMGVIFKQPTTDGSGTKIQAPRAGYEDYFESVREFLPGPRRWVPVLKITPVGQVALGEMLVERGWASR